MGVQGAIPRPLAVRLVLVGLVAVASTVSLLLRDSVAFTAGTVLGIPPAFFTAAFCVDAAVRRRGRMRAAWALLAVFMLLYGASDVLWLHHARTGSETSVMLSDTGFLLAFVPGTVALFVYPAVRWQSGMLRPLLLDAVVLALAVVHLTHTLVLRTLFDSGMRLSEAIMLTAYPIGSGLGAAVATLLILRSTGKPRPDMVLIGVAFLMYTVADNGFSLVAARGETPFSFVIDLAYTAGPLFFAAAASVAATTSTPQRTLRRHLRGGVTPVIPDAAALLALVAAVLLAGGETVTTVLGVITIVAVGARQVAQTYDAWQLRAALESRVDERTRELAELTEAYQQLDSIKNEFVTAVSHELRTPLAAIRGSLEMLQDGDAGELPPAARPMITMATRGSERLSRLVDDIIHLERLEGGTFGFDPAVHPVGDLLAEAVHSLCSLAQERGVEVRVTAARGHAVCDPDRVTQVLVNLLGNALKFSEAGTRIEVSSRADGGRVLVSVADQGRGIPADELERVFERFHQVGMDDSRQQGGTGLGLTISRRIVERHGGRIWAESEGRGTTFHFTLPRAPEVPAEAPVPPGSLDSADVAADDVAHEMGDQHGQQPAGHVAQHRPGRRAPAQA